LIQPLCSRSFDFAACRRGILMAANAKKVSVSSAQLVRLIRSILERRISSTSAVRLA
jgi:hypothetical protein